MTQSKASKKDKPYGGSIDLTRLFGSNSEELAQSETNAPKNFLPLAQIHRKPEQVRRYFDPQKMEHLTASVREYGILENLLVRPMPGKPGEYELVAGERRYRAAQGVGLTEVPATILELSDQQALQQGKIEYTKAQTIGRVKDEGQRQELLQAAIAQDLSIRDIRDRIKQLSQSQNTASQPPDYLKRFNAVSRQLKKTSAWEDREKRDRLETLLKEIEDLVQ